MCVPKNAENAELAIEYINFMNSEEMAIANAEYICYASPNTLVQNNESYRETMTDVHPDAMEVLYGFDDSNLEYFHDLPNDTRALMNTLWEELKIESSMGITVYILCGVFGGTMIGIAIWRFAVRRKRRKYY
jgi:spermidine/putrescine transport system substrate-binding protein